jgi:P22 coat protein - gene protein 5
MANTITNLIPTLYEAMNVVSREMVGIIPAVTRNIAATRGAVNQTVRVPVPTVAATQEITPAVTAPNAGDATVGFIDMTISKARAVPIRWTGEEQRTLSTGDTAQGSNILRDQFAEAMRQLVNEMEADGALAIKAGASRAVGTAGTTPFATAANMDDLAALKRVLEDNGAPQSDLQFVGNAASWANLRGKQNSLFRVNEAGSSDMLREGMTDRLYGFAMRNSGQIGVHTKGTGTSYVTSGSTAVGATSVALVTGSGTVVPGDVVTFAADAVNKYVVKTGVGAPGTIVLNKNGARVVIATANAMTIGNNYTPNFGFARSAVVLLQRLPALPDGGDMADDRVQVTDPISGITFEVATYRQYRQVYYEVAACWGWGIPNEAHIATLLG